MKQQLNMIFFGCVLSLLSISVVSQNTTTAVNGQATIERISSLDKAVDTCEEYKVEFYCNQILEAINKLPPEEQRKNNAFIDKERAKAYTNLAFYYSTISMYSKAEEYALKAIPILENKNIDNSLLSEAYNNLATAYVALKKNDAAISLYKKNIAQYFAAKDSMLLATAYNNIAHSYSIKRDFDHAILFANKSLELRKQLHQPVEQLKLIELLNYIYLERNDFRDAESSVEKAKELLIAMNKKDYDYRLYHMKARLYQKMGDNKKAIEMFETALKYPNIRKDRLLTINNDLYSLYLKEKNYNLALYYFKIARQFEDTINIDKAKIESNVREAKFEYAQKEVLLKAEQEKAQAQYAAEKKRRETTLMYGTAFCLLILMFLLFAWNRARMLARQKEIISTQRDTLQVAQTELNEKNTLLDKQNRTILDNMSYAQIIQSSLLPTEADLKKTLKHDCFMQFVPKDIVSGDFYWCFEKNNQQLFVLADCTGHGVTGAFISIVAIKSLEKSVAKYELSNITAIINDLHGDFMHSFKNEVNQFGIDLVICCFDFLNHTLMIGGSSNSYYIYTDQGITSHTYNNLMIGSTRFNKDKIQVHVIQLVGLPLRLYLFTDGFSDQKGGDNMKRYTTRRLVEKLAQIQNTTMSEQKKILEAAFVDWRKNRDQVDDVSVFGMEIDQLL